MLVAVFTLTLCLRERGLFRGFVWVLLFVGSREIRKGDATLFLFIYNAVLCLTYNVKRYTFSYD